jgi:hypothetical protein
MFADPLGAAIWYDKEARKLHGARALLNFPSGCPRSATASWTCKQSPCGPEGPASNGQLPAGEGKLLAVPGPEVSGTSCLRGDLSRVRYLVMNAQRNPPPEGALVPSTCVPQATNN